MKTFWRKYGLWIQITVLVATIIFGLYYRLWEDFTENKWLWWLQFSILLYYLIDRIVKLKTQK